MKRKFAVEIDLGNDEFSDRVAREAAVARILREIAQKVSAGVMNGPIFDINGNKVGIFYRS